MGVEWVNNVACRNYQEELGRAVRKKSLWCGVGRTLTQFKL